MTDSDVWKKREKYVGNPYKVYVTDSPPSSMEIEFHSWYILCNHIGGG
jgi:hypothetical protein